MKTIRQKSARQKTILEKTIRQKSLRQKQETIRDNYQTKKNYRNKP